MYQPSAKTNLLTERIIRFEENKFQSNICACFVGTVLEREQRARLVSVCAGQVQDSDRERGVPRSGAAGSAGGAV